MCFVDVDGKHAFGFDYPNLDRVATALTDRDKLQVLCAERKWKVVDVPADGDCMFHGLASQIQSGPNPSSAQDIRSALVEFVRANRNIVSLTQCLLRFLIIFSFSFISCFCSVLCYRSSLFLRDDWVVKEGEPGEGQGIVVFK